MDGLSAASGCIAVISLAIQLGDSVYKLYEFFESIKDAPVYVIRLRDSVNRLRILLKEVQTLLEQQGARRYAPPPSYGICNALSVCQKTLSSLELQVARLDARMAHQRLVRMWNSVKIPADKEKVQQAHAEVEGAIAVLQLAMQMNSTQLSLAHMDQTDALAGLVQSRISAPAGPPQSLGGFEQGYAHTSQPSKGQIVSDHKWAWKTILGTFRSRTVYRKHKSSILTADDEPAGGLPLFYETTIEFIPSFGYRVFIMNVCSMYAKAENAPYFCTANVGLVGDISSWYCGENTFIYNTQDGYYCEMIVAQGPEMDLAAFVSRTLLDQPRSAEETFDLLRHPIFESLQTELMPDLTDLTFLHGVLNTYHDESATRFQVWLQVLSYFGYDVNAYLARLCEWIESGSVREKWSRPRRFVVNRGESRVSWEWEFDHQEPALELCKEFQSLLLHDQSDPWQEPYAEFYEIESYCRFPRRIRKAAKHEHLKAVRRKAKSGSRQLPGAFSCDAFGLGDEWYDDRCLDHLQLQSEEPWGCYLCTRKRRSAPLATRMFNKRKQ
ncbi:hypothetical protein MBLNU459_g8058t1 [Dothideomycetes sp. NU459]